MDVKPNFGWLWWCQDFWLLLLDQVKSSISPQNKIEKITCQEEGREEGRVLALPFSCLLVCAFIYLKSAVYLWESQLGFVKTRSYDPSIHRDGQVWYIMTWAITWDARISSFYHRILIHRRRWAPHPTCGPAGSGVSLHINAAFISSFWRQK